jgi:hypothetical protein
MVMMFKAICHAHLLLRDVFLPLRQAPIPARAQRHDRIPLFRFPHRIFEHDAINDAIKVGRKNCIVR